jgi:AcrR family transcriptional regulator
MPEVSFRERRRLTTLAEIKAIALAQLSTAGPDGLSLRAVARELGMSVQALYHYFASREALLTALVTDAHDALADAVRDGAEASLGADPAQRLVAAGLAYRRWAVENRSAFLLIYGVPQADYAAEPGGPTTAAAIRLAFAFRGVVFDGWSREQLEAVELPDADPAFTDRLTGASAAIDIDLPPGAFALFVSAWAQLHGLVMLEVLEHLPWLAPRAPDLYRVALGDLAGQLAARRSG